MSAITNRSSISWRERLSQRTAAPLGRCTAVTVRCAGCTQGCTEGIRRGVHRVLPPFYAVYCRLLPLFTLYSSSHRFYTVFTPFLTVSTPFFYSFSHRFYTVFTPFSQFYRMLLLFYRMFLVYRMLLRFPFTSTLFTACYIYYRTRYLLPHELFYNYLFPCPPPHRGQSSWLSKRVKAVLAV